MAEPAHTAGAHAKRSGDQFSIAWVILASVLGGLGVFALAYWLLTGDWIYFVGVPLVIGSCLMFFSPRMGADHA